MFSKKLFLSLFIEASNNPSGTTGLEDHATTGFNDQRWNWVNNFDQGLPENTERDSNLSHIRQSFHQSTFPQSVHDHLNFQDHQTQSQVPAPYFQTSQLDQSSNFLQYHHQRLQDHRPQFPEGLNNLDYLQIDLNTSVHSIEEPGSIEGFRWFMSSLFSLSLLLMIFMFILSSLVRSFGFLLFAYAYMYFMGFLD